MAPDRNVPLRAAPWIAAGALAATLAAGLLVPVYTDEVAWRLQLSRAPLDGGVDRGLAEQCGVNTTMAAPWFLQPMRHLTAWGEWVVADPRSVRLLGVALAFVAFGLIAAIARAADRRDGRPGFALAAGLLGFGTLPWLLVWNRPEQPILLMLAAAVLLALAARDTPAAAWWRPAAIVGCAIVALGYHPKAVVFAPVFAVAAACAGRGARGRWARIGAVALIALLAAQAFAYWNARFACPGDPVVAARQAAESAFAAHRPGDSWSGLVGALAANLSPMDYVLRTGAGMRQMSDWLPVVRAPHALVLGWLVAVAIVWQAAWLALPAGLLLGLREARRERRIDRRLPLAAAILACLLAWTALQSNKNAYESALMLPLTAIALLLVLPVLRRAAPRATARAALGVALLAVGSEALLLATYLPALVRTAARPGPIPDQPYSVTPWGYPALRRDILATARSCAIRDDARYLLVDDLTYWPYLASWRPQHQVAVLGDWRGMIGDPLAYLAARRSSGIIVQCADLPPALRERAKARGAYCCLSAPMGDGH